MYLLAQDKAVYCLTERGEIEVPRALQDQLRARFFTEENKILSADRARELVKATNRLQRMTRS